MSRHRSPSGPASPELQAALDGAVVRVRNSHHRLPPPSSAMRGRMVVAAVAAGAFAAATAGPALQGAAAEFTPLASPNEDPAHYGAGGGAAPGAPVLVSQHKNATASAEAKKLTAAKKVTDNRKEREAAAREEARRPKFVAPTQGVLTSMYGARWGTTHYGIDIANSIGTPIHSAADGTVIEVGPASGFGNWVRIQHDDGSITVYGHMFSYSVHEGQRVKAGDQIAQIGNAGQSTGPHLHFEVWQGENGAKIDPLTWLANHGISL